MTQTRFQRDARTEATRRKASAVMEYAATHPLGPGAVWEKTSRMNGRPCDGCMAVDGVTVPVGDVYPNGYVGPPYHLNCQCEEDLTSRNLGFAERIARQILQ